MGTKIQEFEATFDISRAFRQFQNADKTFANGKDDAAVKHLKKGYSLFEKALGHLASAVEDAYKKAANKIEKGNSELEKSIAAFADGKDDSAARHYSDAMNYYDEALDAVD